MERDVWTFGYFNIISTITYLQGKEQFQNIFTQKTFFN